MGADFKAKIGECKNKERLGEPGLTQKKQEHRPRLPLDESCFYFILLNKNANSQAPAMAAIFQITRPETK